MQESGSDVECSEESSSSEEEEDAEFSANEEDGKINPTSSNEVWRTYFGLCKTKNKSWMNIFCVFLKLRMKRTP